MIRGSGVAAASDVKNGVDRVAVPGDEMREGAMVGGGSEFPASPLRFTAQAGEIDDEESVPGRLGGGGAAIAGAVKKLSNRRHRLQSHCWKQAQREKAIREREEWGGEF